MKESLLLKIWDSYIILFICAWAQMKRVYIHQNTLLTLQTLSKVADLQVWLKEGSISFFLIFGVIVFLLCENWGQHFVSPIKGLWFFFLFKLPILFGIYWRSSRISDNFCEREIMCLAIYHESHLSPVYLLLPTLTEHLIELEQAREQNLFHTPVLKSWRIAQDWYQSF